jgi:hypothetical protein
MKPSQAASSADKHMKECRHMAINYCKTLLCVAFAGVMALAVMGNQNNQDIDLK